GHFGMCQNPKEVYAEIRKWLPTFMETGESVFLQNKDKTIDELTPLISEKLYDRIHSYLSELNIPNNHKVYRILKMDIDICSMGLADYFIRKNKEQKR